METFEQDTIVAISTPVGRGGIGVVRLSGTCARAVVAPLLRLRNPIEAGRARFGVVLDLTGGEQEKANSCGITNKDAGGDETGQETDARALDEVVVTFFAAPKSYTGEDVVEIAAHGSPVLLEYIVRQCCAGGARLAEPGEFTQRAFLAGRIDLTQAEAVDDLIGSSTLEQARVAARQMGGALTKVVAPAKEKLVGLIAAMEAGIDFAEDDIDVMAATAIAAKIAEVRAPLADLERSFAYGRVVRDGFKLAIVGRPNAGKSSLFNRLVERDRAIVTATPGTTRDLVTERVAIAGIPVDLIDTAGLREGTDEAERMGIAKSHEAMADADVVLLVVDATLGMGDEDRAVLKRGALVAWNKSDLVQVAPTPPTAQHVPSRTSQAPFTTPGVPSSTSQAPSSESQAPSTTSQAPFTMPLVPSSTSQAPSSESHAPSTTSGAPSSRSLTAQGGVSGNARPPSAESSQIPSPIPARPIPGSPSEVRSLDTVVVRTSAVTGEGLAELRAAIVAAVAGDTGGVREAGILTNLRQHQAVAQALAGLAAAQTAVESAIPHEMVMLDLYEALRGLDALTGATTSEDVLRLIFAKFCIGK